MNKDLSKTRKDKLRRLIDLSKSRIKGLIPLDTSLFILQVIKHPGDIGAVAPSSVHLAEAITRHVESKPEIKSKKKYLEVGAGTGAFTKMIIDKLSPDDHLDVIEINQKFCDLLKIKYSKHSNVHIHAGSILDWKPDYKYDAIVSSLPFNAFKASFVEDIFKHYQKISKPGGYVSYCEYMVLPGIRKMFSSKPAKKTLQETQDITKKFQNKFQVGLEKVFANLPPASVYHCQFPRSL